MKISVVITTARWGGFDVLCNCLWAQTFKDFEVVVVDELYEARRKTVASKYILHHIEGNPRNPIYDNTAGYNKAIANAQGELVCFLVDYMWVPPDYLERHWDFYQKHGPHWTLTGYIDRYQFPKIKKEKDEDGLALSVFENEFTAEFAAYWFKREADYRERKGAAGIVHDGVIEMPGNMIYLIPDSVPMALLKELNGLDEIYDGGYGANDIDFGTRANAAGHHWGLDPSLIVQKLGVPSSSASIPGLKKKKIRSPEENYMLYQARMKAIGEGRESLAVPKGRGAFE